METTFLQVETVPIWLEISEALSPSYQVILILILFIYSDPAVVAWR